MNDLIGIPYRRGAVGPDAIDCWNLVREVCRRVHGVDLPLLAEAGGAVALGARGQGWRPVKGRPAPGDILLMKTATGDRHTGFVVRVRHCLEVLHAIEGGSVRQPIADLPLLGFHSIHPWRYDRTPVHR